MWKPAKNGMVVSTVGGLKRILEDIPDDYALSVIGCNFGMLVDDDEKLILFDEVPYLENILIEQEEC